MLTLTSKLRMTGERCQTNFFNSNDWCRSNEHNSDKYIYRPYGIVIQIMAFLEIHWLLLISILYQKALYFAALVRAKDLKERPEALMSCKYQPKSPVGT